MTKKRRWLVWPLIYVFPFVLVLALAYSLVSARFSPPDDVAPPPVVRKFPLAAHDSPPAPIRASNEETVQPPGTAPANGDSAWVTALVQDFQSRHPDDLGNDYGYLIESNRRDFFHIGYLVLKDEESHETLLKLISDPEVSVRIAAMKALGQARGTLMDGGHSALLGLWRKLDERQIDAVVAAATETLLYETEHGQLSSIPSLLHTMGDHALPALPHLAWVSNHHPEADMRTWTVNMAMLMDPSSPVVDDLLERRLLDPNPWVRLNALQSTALRAVAALAGVEHMGPPTATSESALKSLESSA